MVDVQKQIEETRKQFELRKKEVSPYLSQMALRVTDQPMTALLRRKPIVEYLGKIKEAEEAFEREVAEKAPIYAKEEYLQPYKEKAEKELSERIAQLDAKIERMRAMKHKDESDRKYLRELNAEKRTYLKYLEKIREGDRVTLAKYMKGYHTIEASDAAYVAGKEYEIQTTLNKFRQAGFTEAEIKQLTKGELSKDLQQKILEKAEVLYSLGAISPQTYQSFKQIQAQLQQPKEEIPAQKITPQIEKQVTTKEPSPPMTLVPQIKEQPENIFSKIAGHLQKGILTLQRIGASPIFLASVYRTYGRIPPAEEIRELGYWPWKEEKQIKEFEKAVKSYDEKVKAYTQELEKYNKEVAKATLLPLPQNIEKVQEMHESLVKKYEELNKERIRLEEKREKLQLSQELKTSTPMKVGTVLSSVLFAPAIVPAYLAERALTLDVRLPMEIARAKTEEERLAKIEELKKEMKETAIAAAIWGGTFAAVKAVPHVKAFVEKKIISPQKYVPIEETGLVWTRGVTQPQTIQQLTARVGKEVPITHATVSPLPKGKFVIEMRPEAAGGFRRTYGLFQYYGAAPHVPTEKPQVYTGYLGLERYAEKAAKTVAFPKRTVLIFRDQKIHYPRGKNIFELAEYVRTHPGKWYVAPENIMGLSIEGQYVTGPAGVKIGKMFYSPKVGEEILKKVKDVDVVKYPGAIVKDVPGPLAGKYTYYYAPEKAPFFLRIFGIKEIKTPHKVAFREVTLEPIGKETKVKPSSLIDLKIVPSEKIFSTAPIKEPSYAQVTPALSLALSSPEYAPSSVSIISAPEEVSILSFSVAEEEEEESKEPSPPSEEIIPSEPSTPTEPEPFISPPEEPSLPSKPPVFSISPPTKTSWPPSTLLPPSKGKKEITNLFIPKKPKLETGYIVMVKRGGKWVKLSGIYPKAEAIKKGAKHVLETLAATFKIVPTKKIVKAIQPSETKPSPLHFREYQIVKGKKVPLKDIWIQKAGWKIEAPTAKGARLGRRSEVEEILAARRRKIRTKKLRLGLKPNIKPPKKINILKMKNIFLK